jgi:predicted Zn finger-like uncharacterized protein
VVTPRYIPSPADGVDSIELYGDRPEGFPVAGQASAEGAPNSPDGTSRGVPATSRPVEETVGVQCPLCHTRLHVAARKMGRTVRCPDCHHQFPAKPHRVVKSRPAPTSPATESGDEDEYRLGDECQLPKYQPLTRGEISRAQLDSVDRRGKREESRASAEVRPVTGKPASEPERIKIICPFCDTRLWVQPTDVGSVTTCGDCGNRVKVKLPPTRRRSHGPTELAPDEESEPIRVQEVPGEEARSRADWEEARRLFEQERQRESERVAKAKARERSRSTYWQQLTAFLWEPEVATRLLLLSILFGATSVLGAGIARMAASEDAAQWAFTIPLSLFLSFATFITWIYGASVMLTVLQDTAEDYPVIESWSHEVVEWFYQALQIFVAVVAAGVLASVVILALSSLPLPSWLLGIAMLTFYFLLFPVVLLSILEGEHLLCLLSPAILSSVVHGFSTWLRFHAVGFGLIFAGMVLEAGTYFGGTWVALLVAPFMVLLGLLYARALGLLAGRCSSIMGELALVAESSAKGVE